jgi:O-antigen ligase
VSSKELKLVTKDPTLFKILSGIVLVTLYFNTQSTDPFNSPKLWVLILFAAVLLGEIIIKRRYIFMVTNGSKPFIFSTLFILSLFVSFLFSDQKYTAFFGDYLRKNGFLQYICLFVIFISAAISIKKEHFKQINNMSLLLGLILSIYGFLQHFGKDFVAWNNPYNSVILTVGNPNFAAALLSFLLLLNVSAFMNSSVKNFIRIAHLGVSILLLTVIIFSNARQGLVAGSLGLIVFVIVLTYKKHSKFGSLLAVLSFTLGILVTLGMLQKGPLASIMYKGSVSIRGYYWRAAIEMFKDHPLFGVGLDSYGLFFKQYRESQYSLNYGFTITSSNAHNTFLQFFSTGGIFVGVFYLLFLMSVFVLAIGRIKQLQGNELVFFLGLFGAWISFQAQSLISIDNIGISVWNWVLSGFLVGLCLNRSEPNQNKLLSISNTDRSKTTLLAWSLFILNFVFVSMLYQGENRFLKLRDGINPAISANKELIYEKVTDINNTLFIDPQYKLFALSYLSGSEYHPKIEQDLLALVNSSPRNLDYLGSLANFYQNIGDINNEIKFRKKIVELDPWNAQNLLSLGLAYKSTSQIIEMQNTRNLILEFAADEPIGLSAKSELQD